MIINKPSITRYVALPTLVITAALILWAEIYLQPKLSRSFWILIYEQGQLSDLLIRLIKIWACSAGIAFTLYLDRFHVSLQAIAGRDVYLRYRRILWDSIDNIKINSIMGIKYVSVYERGNKYPIHLKWRVIKRPQNIQFVSDNSEKLKKLYDAIINEAKCSE